MRGMKSFLGWWKSDYDFRTVAAASGSLAVTAVFALYNGFLGVYHSSLWHGTICVYYLVLAILRGVIVSASIQSARESDPVRFQRKFYTAAAALLLFLNICLIVPVSLMAVRAKPVNLTLIPAIAMAAYTTYKVIMASVNLRRRKRSPNRLLHLLRAIGFIDALVSILSLQNTLIMVNMREESTEMLALTAATSAAVMLAVLAISAVAMGKGIAARKDS